ncbi:uncharacterized protein LOC121380141 isoform X2 [Gigantopelta aegis]|uniref:uncharacterized protein LOC121380141 isoform X2 n=1 Tax=Gigantopelta aegis TaxID=1735272 RepID=UPI001B889B43|nr:uncharacterized protein LOC121380141 isoform X2 [Gigantopelta aegis]
MDSQSKGFNILHYDYYVRKMAILFHTRQDDGTMKVTHILYDFTKNKTYISGSGSCNVTAIPPGTTFREPCIPDDAKFLGSTYMGYGASHLPLYNWEIKKASHPNITKRMAVTQGGCTPVLEATYGYADHNGAKFDVVYVFNNYHPRIRRRDVFDIPHICNPGMQSDIPEQANRVVRTITNLFQ